MRTLFASSIFAAVSLILTFPATLSLAQSSSASEPMDAPTEMEGSQSPGEQVSMAGNRSSDATQASAGTRALIRPVSLPKLPDFNRRIYYKNKLELSLESGWLPVNIPFVFDFLVNSPYTTWPLRYTLQPNLLSLRWQLDNIWGRKLFRGNTDFSFSGAYTGIPRGAETRYFAFDYGIRRNFIPRRSRFVPYVEGRGGIGDINAKGPKGVEYAQGQNMTFTLMVGSGVRYSINPKWGISGGMTYMHVSNFYLSEPRYQDFGINVYGAIVGVYMRVGKPKQAARVQ
jgi:hypothetical protein